MTTNTATQTTTWTVDPAHVEVGFSVRHLMISTVRGRFGTVSGTVIMDEANPENSKVDVTVDVTDAVVTLQGVVPERRMKHAIEDIAADCRGVAQVENRIRVVRGGAEPLLER